MARSVDTTVTSRAEDAAYKALAALRLSAAVRRDIAVRTVAALTEIPAEHLPFLVEAGAAAALVREIARTIPSTAMDTTRRDEAAAVAMVAAAKVMAESARGPKVRYFLMDAVSGEEFGDFESLDEADRFLVHGGISGVEWAESDDGESWRGWRQGEKAYIVRRKTVRTER